MDLTTPRSRRRLEKRVLEGHGGLNSRTGRKHCHRLEQCQILGCDVCYLIEILPYRNDTHTGLIWREDASPDHYPSVHVVCDIPRVFCSCRLLLLIENIARSVKLYFTKSYIADMELMFIIK